jgi:hypothetical protein
VGVTVFSGETTVEHDVGTCLMCGSPDLTGAFRLEVEQRRFDSLYDARIHGRADSQMIEAANLRRLHRTAAGRG